MTRAAKIVWFIGLAIFIGWLTHRAFGQTFQRSLPFLAKPISVTTTNQDPSGSGYLGYRWVASDLATGPVTNWFDRIQNTLFTNVIAKRPTNGPTGVYFDGSATHLTNNYILRASNNLAFIGSVYFILNPARVNGTFNDVLGNIVDFHGWNLDSSMLNHYQGGDIAKPMHTGLQDWAMTWSLNVADKNCYTNGILSMANAYPPAVGDSFPSLGYAGNGYYQGSVLELFFFTNVITALQVSNIHYYATNTYDKYGTNGFTP